MAFYVLCTVPANFTDIIGSSTNRNHYIRTHATPRLVSSTTLKCCCFFNFLHDPCSFSFSCFPVVDLFTHTGDFIDDVNILNTLTGVDLSDQRLNKANMDDILLSFFKCPSV